MILHDRVDITSQQSDQFGNIVVVVIAAGVPCELTPLNSEPADASGPITTRYRLVTAYDLTTIDGTVALVYRDQGLQVEGGFERHTMLGRFHHIEAVVADFY